jgi:hypothetical protein
MTHLSSCCKAPVDKGQLLPEYFCTSCGEPCTTTPTVGEWFEHTIWCKKNEDGTHYFTNLPLEISNKLINQKPTNPSTVEELRDLLSKYNAVILNSYQDIYLMDRGPGCEEVLYPVLEKAIKDFFELPNDGMIRKDHVAEFLAHSSTLTDSTLREVEKAYGGCRKCYGKGYSTVLEHYSGHGESDVGQGDVSVFGEMPRMNFCSCERGKALKKEIEFINKRLEK